MGFLGDFQHNIDQKNRVFIPAKFRDALGDSFIVCRAPSEKCLFIYSQEKWQRLSDEVNSLAPSPQTRQRQRQFFYGSQTAEPDKQGRITIGQKLCEYAGLTKEATIFGAGERIEIWDTETWEALMNAEESGLDEMEIHY